MTNCTSLSVPKTTNGDRAPDAVFNITWLSMDYYISICQARFNILLKVIAHIVCLNNAETSR
jgi:hypothetical protein